MFVPCKPLQDSVVCEGNAYYAPHHPTDCFGPLASQSGSISCHFMPTGGSMGLGYALQLLVSEKAQNCHQPDSH
jgi:hypothetical protein